METPYGYQLALENPCSYRTYEEWKHTWYNNVNVVRVRSYRTYEEWKLGLSKRPRERLKRFLPYLWGMETGDDG